MFQFNNIPPNIQKNLFKRMNALSRTGNMSPLGLQTEQQSNSVSEMMTKACWVRVTAAVPDFKKDDTGKYIEPLEKLHTPMRLSSAFQDGQPLNRPLTSQTNLLNNKPNDTLRAHTGITGVSTSFKNHSIQNVTINWKLWDINDFEVYEKAFLKHGRTVLVEFGWSTPETKTLPKVEKPEDMIQYYDAIQEKIIKSGGDYYAAIGVIKSFSYNIGVNGEFDCTTELTSMGNTLFKGAVDPTDNPVPELIRNKNTKTAEEAFQKSQTTFETYLKDLNKNINKEMSKGYPDIYYNSETNKGYCSWGWFEDNILNTFFGFVTKKKGSLDGSISPLTTSIQSIGTKYKVTSTADSTEVQEFETIRGNNKCRSSDNLYTKSRHIQFPGRYIGLNALGKAGEADGGFTTGVALEYKHIMDTFSNINEFSPFIETDDNPDKYGSIRNIVFSADFLAQEFSGIRNLEDGLTSFWSTVNSEYGTFWSFKVVQDQGSNGRIGVVDQLVAEHRIKDINPKLDGKKSTIKDPNHCFEFPLYSNRSLFKDFSLEVKLSSQMATQAMFHSNKNFSTQGEDESGKPEDIGITALASLQNQTMTDKTANVQGQEDSKDFLLDEIWIPYLGDPTNNKGPMLVGRVDPSDTTSDLELKVIDVQSNLEGLTTAQETVQDTEQRVKTEEKVSEFTEANNWFDPEQPAQKDDALVYTAKGDMLNSFQKSMLWLMNKSSEAKAQVDPITPLNISFTIPGIGGISMYDLFAVDYLPKQYRDYGLFQVNAVDHTLSPSGWDTKISGLLRVDMDSLIKSAKAAGQYEEGDSTEINLNYDSTATMSVLQFKQNAKKVDDKKASTD